MTPAQERALLEVTAAGLEGRLRAAQTEMVRLIRQGVDPREAVQTVMDSFRGEIAQSMAIALSAILGQSVGTAAVLQLRVGAVRLSQRLYGEGQTVGAVVAGVVRRHTEGFLDARRLALELFEGYTFRPPDQEPLQFNPREPRLPKYLREALVSDATVRGDMVRAFARLQVRNLSTPALQAAYNQALQALDGIEGGSGARLLNRRLEVAFFERMRFFAERIARTEIHRSYMDREALLLMEDDDVEFIQLRRAPGKGEPCICALMAGRDLYGLGPGVYPKADAPRPPLHPFCRCVLSPRLDLTGRSAEQRDTEGDRYFLRRLDAPIAARVMGSQAKRDRVLSGSTAEQVANAGRNPEYRISTVGERIEA